MFVNFLQMYATRNIFLEYFYRILYTTPFYCHIYARDGDDERYSLISICARLDIAYDNPISQVRRRCYFM